MGFLMRKNTSFDYDKLMDFVQRFIFLALAFLTPHFAHSAPSKSETGKPAASNDSSLMGVGLRVWQNECAATVEGLTSWNDGEEFASLGIGHFIWHPAGSRSKFVETFPELIRFLQSEKVELPRWLEDARFCPWKNRRDFQRSCTRGDRKIKELRTILKNTVGLQAKFLSMRVDRALVELTAHAPEKEKAKIAQRYQKIREHRDGLYVLIDYVNFKGYGTSEQERYQGTGWGLFQVLTEMSDDPKADPVKEFVLSAKKLLEKRVQNAPIQRNEQRYLNGWFARLDSYIQER